jgi:hypothetical protein
MPGHHRDATELATLHPDATFTAASTTVRSTGRRA